MHQRKSFALNLFDHHREYLLLADRVFGQEDKSRAILSLFGDGDALQQNELVGNLQENARTVASLVVGTFGSAMPHVLEHLQCVVYQFVALVTVDVYHHAHTTRVVFVLGIIQSFIHHKSDYLIANIGCLLVNLTAKLRIIFLFAN